MRQMNIDEKLRIIDSLFYDGRFDTYFSRGLGQWVSLPRIRELWAEMAADIARGAAPDFCMLYAHTPFCVSRCSYCIYDSSVVAGQRDLGAHLMRMSRECAALGPVLAPVKFACMLIGGGTPSLHTDRNFELMLRMITETFDIMKGGIRSVEMTPVTTTGRKTAIMAR